MKKICFAVGMCVAFIIAKDDSSKNNKKAIIKGDALVILEASCNSDKMKKGSALDKFKDSKGKQSGFEECEDIGKNNKEK